MAASSKLGSGEQSSLQSILSSGIIQSQDSVSLELQPAPIGLAAAYALISISDIAEVGLTVDPLELTGLDSPSNNGRC